MIKKILLYDFQLFTSGVRIFNENAHFRRWYFSTWLDFFVVNHSQYVSVWCQITFSLIFSTIKKIILYDLRLFMSGVTNTHFQWKCPFSSMIFCNLVGFFVLNHSQYVSVWSQITFSLTFLIIKKIVPYDFWLSTLGFKNRQFWWKCAFSSMIFCNLARFFCLKSFTVSIFMVSNNFFFDIFND